MPEVKNVGSIPFIHSVGRWFETARNILNFVIDIFYHVEGSWFESSKHRIMINTEAKANCLTVVYPPTPSTVFRGFEPGVFSLEVLYTKL